MNAGEEVRKRLDNYVASDIAHQRWETGVELRAIDVYGVNNQTWQTLEEIFELGLAICKLRRERTRDRYSDLVEEIADVGIMLDQIMLMYDCQDAVHGVRTDKLARLERRLNGGE